MRLVVANGDGRYRLASIVGGRLAELGYEQIDLGDAARQVDATIVYYRDGFVDIAGQVAADIGVPDALLVGIPADLETPLTNSDDNGDVIVILGPDAPR